ncbi:MAG: VanZ family protein [Polyangiales bacterium]
MSERRARLCLGLLMVCICGSLGFAHDITRPIRRAGMLRGLIALAFAVPAVLGVRALARRGLLRERRTWVVLGGAVAAYALAVWRTVTWEETLHLIEYGLVGVLARASVPRDWSPPRAWVGSWLGAAALGAVDELIQAWLPHRTGDLGDVALNAVAAGIPLVIAYVLSEPRALPAWLGGATTDASTVESMESTVDARDAHEGDREPVGTHS